MEIYCQAESNRNWKQLSKLHHDLPQHTHFPASHATQRETLNTGHPAITLIGQQNNTSRDDSLPTIQCHCEYGIGGDADTHMSSVCLWLIHWAETLPCETLDSPEESTCEAVGHKMLISLFDPFPQKPTKVFLPLR